MEVPLQHKECQLWHLEGIVSILVLMEVPLQPKKINTKKMEYIRFNPCFNGSSSATISKIIMEFNDKRFQSLF